MSRVLGLELGLGFRWGVHVTRNLGCNLEDVVVASASDARMRPVGDGVIRHIQPHPGEANARLVCPPHPAEVADRILNRGEIARLKGRNAPAFRCGVQDQGWYSWRS